MSIGKIFSKVFGEQIFVSNLRENEDKPQGNVSASTATVAEAIAVATTPKVSELPMTEQIAKVKQWLNEKLQNVDNRCEELISQQKSLMGSRLGPERVIFDIEFESTLRISSDRLTVRSQGSFNTVKANVCVFGGQWMYEFQLHSKGVMQIGWCSSKCVFNDNSGVGDTKHSYGFDGSKQKIWHISTNKYGENWESGDIIGVCFDVDNEKIEYYRNGKSLGEAFKKIDKGPGISFFPAVSLGYNEGLKGNFGSLPFRYPVEGYHPLQTKPYAQLEKSDLLLGYLVNIAGILSRPKYRKDKKSKDPKFSTKKTIYAVFCSMLIEKLAEVIFDEYVIEDKLLLYIKNLCVLRSEADKDSIIIPGSIDSTLGTLLSTLWNYMEADEIKFILKKLINILLASFTQISKGLDYERQRKVIVILNCICNHPVTRKFYLENKFFKKNCLPLFLYLRPPEYTFMKELLPDEMVWTEGIGGPKCEYFIICEKITKSVDALYVLQKSLIQNLLTNTDGDDMFPSSRKIFISKLRRYVIDSSQEQKPLQSLFFLQSTLHHPIESPIALSFLCILVDVAATLFDQELPIDTVSDIASKYFFDGTFEYHGFDRLGGVLSHLRKVHRTDIAQHLGADQATRLSDAERSLVRFRDFDSTNFLTSANLNNIAIVGRTQGNLMTIIQRPVNNHLHVSEILPGNEDVKTALCELVDIAILYYYSVAHKYVVKISAVRDEIAALNEILNETTFYRKDVENKLRALEECGGSGFSATHSHMMSELKLKFGHRENVFAKRSIELARKQSWYRAVALGEARRTLLIWLMGKTLKTLQKSSELGPLFAFVPEVYINILPILLDTILEFSFHDLKAQFDVCDAEDVIMDAAAFLSEHSADPRIVLASCKDSLLQAIGTLTCHESGIRALEEAPKRSRLALIKALLRPYENRAWGQSNWLLLRFWMGEGFAYRDSRQPSIWQGGNEPMSIGLCRSRAKNETHTGLLHHIAPANPSKHFQHLIGTRLKEDEPFATAFLNSVLSQLNWAFSEFILLLQEIQNTANRQENIVFEPKQLKICSMCFELTVSLMRCLEMVIVIAPDIFHDSSRPNSDLILNRVCQLISQVLSRVTVPPGCFQFVVDMCSSDLISVTHFSIITAALGILLALMRPEIDDKKPVKITRISRSFLTDPSFQIANLEFALGEIKTPILQQAEIPRGNFDPQTRGHIDPLTNDVRVTIPATSSKRIRANPPIIKFSLNDYPTHVTNEEIDDVRKLIEMLRIKQSLLSDITLPSEDSLCPICCAKPIAATFNPCKHQSCSNCILQHLMNSKVCFYCKTLIKEIEGSDGKIIYNHNENSSYVPTNDD